MIDYLLPNKVINQKRNIEGFIKEFLFFLGFCLLFAFAGAAMTILLGKIWDIDNFSNLAKVLSEKSEPDTRNTIRYYLILSHSFTFALPCIAYAIWRNRQQALSALKLHQTPHPNNILYSGIIILAAFPFVMLTMWLNQQIPISETMIEMEKMANEMAKNLLVMNSTYEFILTLIAVAATAAIGEELMFRGILQPMFEKVFKNGHIAVWITAVLFSAIHGQMHGFIPRMLLGAILGYFFLWSRNLWIPIFAHFVFNGSQVVLKYSTPIQIENPEVEFNQIIIPAIASLVIIIGLGNLFRKFNLQKVTKETNKINENQILDE
ncbi:MAG: lysostaphin resistance A-like protein [Saprospiraceae bacterium]